MLLAQATVNRALSAPPTGGFFAHKRPGYRTRVDTEVIDMDAMDAMDATHAMEWNGMEWNGMDKIDELW